MQSSSTRPPPPPAHPQGPGRKVFLLTEGPRLEFALNHTVLRTTATINIQLAWISLAFIHSFCGSLTQYTSSSESVRSLSVPPVVVVVVCMYYRVRRA